MYFTASATPEPLDASYLTFVSNSCIELSIGLVCACLPSAHFLYERRKANRRNRDYSSNRPRTGRFGTPKQFTSSNSWLSTRKTIRTLHLTGNRDPSTELRTAPDEERAPPMSEQPVAVDAPLSNPHFTRFCCRNGNAGGASCCDESRREAQRAFDLELARFSGKSTDGETDSPPAGSDCPINCAISRVNSLDGRREGWLASRSDAGDTTDVDAVASMHDVGRSRSVGYWDTVWDGTVEDIPR